MATRFSAVKSQIDRSEKSFSQEGFIKFGGFTLRDGRYMEYVQQGHPNGRPILLIHTFLNGPKISAKAAQMAVLRKWRVISPSRAGYGNSDRHRKTDIHGSVTTNAHDMAELVAHFGLRELMILGTTYAQKFAFLYPDLVSHFFCINRVPIWHEDDLHHMPLRFRNMLKTSMYSPLLAKFPVRLMKVLMDTGRERDFFRGLLADSPVDLKALEDPDHFNIMADGIKHSFQQGIDGVTLDVTGQHTDWSEDANTLQVPVTVLLGSESPAQTPKALDRYLEVVPSAKVRIIEGAGMFPGTTHFSEVFDIMETL